MYFHLPGTLSFPTLANQSSKTQPSTPCTRTPAWPTGLQNTPPPGSAGQSPGALWASLWDRPEVGVCPVEGGEASSPLCWRQGAAFSDWPSLVSTQWSVGLGGRTHVATWGRLPNRPSNSSSPPSGALSPTEQPFLQDGLKSPPPLPSSAQTRGLLQWRRLSQELGTHVSLGAPCHPDPPAFGVTAA